MTWLRKLTSKLESLNTDAQKTVQEHTSATLEQPETRKRLATLAATYNWQQDEPTLPLNQLHLSQPSSIKADVREKKRYTKERTQQHANLPLQKKSGTDSELDSNMKALARLRELPRGTQIDSRIAAIQGILGEKEVFRTLHNLRWPEGVVCPRCRSGNIVRRDPPPDAPDARYYYECLNCKGAGNPSGFDGLTGLQVENAVHALRQWILCWYLLGFCSAAQIAKVLGLSLADVAELASLGANLVELPESSLLSYRQSQARTATENRKAQADSDELRAKSSSLGKYKPGPKSKL